MRLWPLLIALAVVIPRGALAKPTLAIAPLDGDRGDKVANAVAKAAASEAAKVMSPKITAKAVKRLDLSIEDLSKRDLRKLRSALGVDVVIHGSVASGREKSVTLRVSGKGVKPGAFRIRYTDLGSKDFRDDVRAQLAKRLNDRGDDDDDDDDDDGKRAKRTKRGDRDDDRKRAKRRDRDDDDDRKRKRVSRDDDDDDDDADDGDDDDGGSVRKKRRRKRRRGDRGDRPNAVTQVAMRASAGAGVGRRTLTYDATGNMRPPRVGTFGPSARIDAEVYPGALSSTRGFVAGLGVFGELDKTFAVGIAVPGTTTTASIDQLAFQIGARYRASIGRSSLAFGLAYARRRYVADRSGLAMATALDMPDVDYAAVAPGVLGRIAVGDKLGIYAGLEVMLVLSAGPIATGANFGPGDAFGFDLAAGVDYALGQHYALRVGLDFDQYGVSYNAPVRGVDASVDRTYGMNAAIAVTY